MKKCPLSLPTLGLNKEMWDNLSDREKWLALSRGLGAWSDQYFYCQGRHSGLVDWVRDG